MIGILFKDTIASNKDSLADLRRSVSGNATLPGNKAFTGNLTFTGTTAFTGPAGFDNLAIVGDFFAVSGEFTGDVTAINYKVGGNQVVGARGAAIADLTVTATSGSLPSATGAVTVANAATPTVVELLRYCVELETKLEALLSRVRTHGLIAP